MFKQYIYTQVKLKRAKYSNHIRYDRWGGFLSYITLVFNGCPLYVKPECEKYSIIICNREYIAKNLMNANALKLLYIAAHVIKLAFIFAQYRLLIKI